MIRDTIPSDIKLPNPSPSHQNNFLKLKRKFTEKKKKVVVIFPLNPNRRNVLGLPFKPRSDTNVTQLFP